MGREQCLDSTQSKYLPLVTSYGSMPKASIVYCLFGMKMGLSSEYPAFPIFASDLGIGINAGPMAFCLKISFFNGL